MSVIRDKSILSTSLEVTLHWKDETPDQAVRASVATLPESRADIEAEFAEAGLNAWVPKSDLATAIGCIDGITIAGTRHAVRDREETGSYGREIVRFQLVEIRSGTAARH